MNDISEHGRYRGMSVGNNGDLELGSINADFVYTVPHIPAPGETLSSTTVATFLGGKGANMSVAGARAAAQVNHIGALGHDGVGRPNAPA